MQYLRICSSTAVAGHILSRASMPRVSLSRDYPQAVGDSVLMTAYRAALVERHLREHLQFSRDGTYFSPRGINLWELIGQSLASEHYIAGEAIASVIADIAGRLKQEGHEPIAESLAREALVGLSAAQRAAIAAALVACGHTLSELTAAEKHMTWLGQPHWLAEDRTIAAELLALLTVRRVKSMQYF
ncbi:MAG: hypothetical protein WC028_31540 [Candidatus Obscuribacterales bacterium]